MCHPFFRTLGMVGVGIGDLELEEPRILDGVDVGAHVGGRWFL